MEMVSNYLSPQHKWYLPRAKLVVDALVCSCPLTKWRPHVFLKIVKTPAKILNISSMGSSCASPQTLLPTAAVWCDKEREPFCTVSNHHQLLNHRVHWMFCDYAPWIVDGRMVDFAGSQWMSDLFFRRKIQKWNDLWLSISPWSIRDDSDSSTHYPITPSSFRKIEANYTQWEVMESLLYLRSNARPYLSGLVLFFGVKNSKVK